MVLGFIFQRGGGGDKQVQRSKGRERRRVGYIAVRVRKKSEICADYIALN